MVPIQKKNFIAQTYFQPNKNSDNGYNLNRNLSYLPDKGFTIRKTNDCLIAAVAIENSCPILHKDKDFNAIAICVDLKLISK